MNSEMKVKSIYEEGTIFYFEMLIPYLEEERQIEEFKEIASHILSDCSLDGQPEKLSLFKWNSDK